MTEFPETGYSVAGFFYIAEAGNGNKRGNPNSTSFL